MQTAITINQRVAREAQLTLQDAAIFSYFWSLKPREPGGYLWHQHRVWFPATPEVIAAELPLVDYAPKTIQASVKKLLDAGLIERHRHEGASYYAVTTRGRAW